MSTQHPTLENDAILEAIFEIRFQHVEGVLPEFFYARIANNADWEDYTQKKLPISEIPESLRRKDQNLHHKPIIELASEDGQIAIRLGPDVLIASRRGDYPGWDASFGDEVRNATIHLFKVFADVKVSRLGMRYINALRSDIHQIQGIADLEVDLKIAKIEIAEHFNLNFRMNVGTDLEVLTRLSTVDFGSGNIPENTSFILDIDVHTSEEYETNDIDAVLAWAEKARTEKNERFFSVLGEANKERLRKK